MQAMAHLLKMGEKKMVIKQRCSLKRPFVDHETPILKKRLLYSVGFLLVLMYFPMGHMMWNWPLPAFMDGNHVMMGLVQLYLTVIIMVINHKFFINGFGSLFPWCSQHGHLSILRFLCLLRLQLLCSVCHDLC